MAKQKDWGSLRKMRSKAIGQAVEHDRYNYHAKSNAHAKFIRKHLANLREEPKLFWCHKCNKFREKEHEHI